MKTITQLIQEIEERKNRGNTLSHFISYMNSINNPHQHVTCIHIAGTNGKGSTLNYIRSILQSAGYKVGTFTSPYLTHHQDRIRIQNQDIPDDILMKYADQYYDSWIKWDLSMFEIDMAIACLWFLEEKVDIAIFETGLGGRLDFTNIIHPLVSVITNIGMDHMHILGDTYEAIAYEKAGIIKTGIDVITAENKLECLRIFQDVAKSKQANCIQISSIENIRRFPHQICFDYELLKDIWISQGAMYQTKNAALAIETCLYLRNQNKLYIEDQHIYEGISSTIWEGRYEIFCKEPLLMIDGAHNKEGIDALVESLEGISDLHILFSVLQDKQFDSMLQSLKQVSNHIMVTNFMNYRSLDMKQVADEQVVYVNNMEETIMRVWKNKKPLVITGSLYFISEVRSFLKSKDWS